MENNQIMKDLTSKEKAKELVEQFKYCQRGFINPVSKQCALIAVDLLLQEIFFENEPIYWQEVKSEIEKM